MSYSIIAAIGKNKELGKNNDLIWHLKGDLKFFKEITTNHTIIMGRKTFDSLPGKLPNRKHIILSSKTFFDNEIKSYKSLEEILEKYKESPEEIFIIGGASIYEQFMPYADKLYLTEIDAEEKTASVYFPLFDEAKYKKEIIKENEDDGISYKHILYKKISQD